MTKANTLTLAERPLERLVRPGIYRIRDAKAPRDPELEHGLLEIYEHPIKGLCFWDQGQDGDSDGHVPVGFLDGEELEYVGPNAIGQGSAACGASPAPTGCASGGEE